MILHVLLPVSCLSSSITGCHGRGGGAGRRLLTSPGRDWKMRFLFHVCQESLKAGEERDAFGTPLWCAG